MGKFHIKYQACSSQTLILLFRDILIFALLFSFYFSLQSSQLEDFRFNLILGNYWSFFRSIRYKTCLCFVRFMKQFKEPLMQSDWLCYFFHNDAYSMFMLNTSKIYHIVASYNLSTSSPSGSDIPITSRFMLFSSCIALSSLPSFYNALNFRLRNKEVMGYISTLCKNKILLKRQRCKI